MVAMSEPDRRRRRLLGVLGLAVLLLGPACFGEIEPVGKGPRSPRPGPTPSVRSTERVRGDGGQGSGRTCGEETSVGLTPLIDLGTGTYKREQGGLYPGGQNEPPPEHEAAGVRLAQSIQPVDASGRPDPDGRYAMLSIGMSNTREEFGALQRMLQGRSIAVAPNLVLVNGAQGGQTADIWADPSAAVWPNVERALQAEGVTAAQVQVVWMKSVDEGPGRWPSYPQRMRDHLESTLHILKDRFPNLRLVYLSSRTFGGYSGIGKRPGQGRNNEPLAYWTGFAVKWLIEDQLEGDPALRFDGGGPAPWIGWGPYLWADGTTPRSDGLTWECFDFSGGLEIGGPGAMKAAQLLLEFFQSDPTARPWFPPGG
jgi:hypothetical protein